MDERLNRRRQVLVLAGSAEDRNALARVLHSAGDATDEDRRVSARQWANLIVGGRETPWHVEADAALAWFAARQPTPTVSAEQVEVAEAALLDLLDEAEAEGRANVDVAHLGVRKVLAALGMEVRDV